MAQSENDSVIDNEFIEYLKSRGNGKVYRPISILDLLDDSDEQSQIGQDNNQQLQLAVRAAKNRDIKRTVELQVQRRDQLLVVYESQVQATSCAICLATLDRPKGKTACQHMFCYSCVRLWLQSDNRCPVCRAIVRELEILDIPQIGQHSRNRLIKERQKQQCGCLQEQKDEKAGQNMVEKYKKSWKWKQQKNKAKQKIPVPEKKEQEEEESQSQQDFQNSSMDELFCYVCGSFMGEAAMLVCDGCEQQGCHFYCDGLSRIPEDDWFCRQCRNGS